MVQYQNEISLACPNGKVPSDGQPYKIMALGTEGLVSAERRYETVNPAGLVTIITIERYASRASTKRAVSLFSF
jgi:hypothetical protein